MMCVGWMMAPAICVCAVLSGAAWAQAPEASPEFDPCAQLEEGPKHAFALYLPRHDREVPIYLPAAWRNDVELLDNALGLLIRPSDFAVTFLTEESDVDLGNYLLFAFVGHQHPDVIPPYEIDRSGQYFTEGPFGLYRAEGIVEEEPLVEYRDEPTEESSMYILCRPWLADHDYSCDMTIPGDEIDVMISLNARELPNWKLHRDRAVKFRNCAMNAA